MRISSASSPAPSQGVIDTKAPLITATALYVGGNMVPRTVYTIDVSDFTLDDASIVQPCAASAGVLTTSSADGHVIGAHVTCSVSGHVQPLPTVNACDSAGHCSTMALTSSQGSAESVIAILSPVSAAHVPVGVTLPITVGAYDPEMINSIALLVNGTQRDTVSVNAIERTWQAAWLPTALGTYTITALMTDGQNNQLSDTITVTVDQTMYPLAVTKLGTGSGTVSSQPSGIDCGASCSALFDHGTVVTLTATADSGSTFDGWSANCLPTGNSCSVFMDQAQSVTATFTLNQHPLTVSVTGSGSGTVSSQPSGIDCGASCSALFDHGTVVTLTATADTGATFAGWSGACSGTALTCTLTLDQARSVTATFTRPRIFLPILIR